MITVLEKAAKIKLIIFDVDGVLTDGKLYYSGASEAYKAFNVKDGLGIKLLQKINIHLAVITGRYSEALNSRMKELGVDFIFQNQSNKSIAFNELLNKLNLKADEVAYIGDDLPDLSLIIKAGLGVAVADAHAAVIEYADWITTKSGGNGAFRELADLIIHAQNKAEDIMELYQ